MIYEWDENKRISNLEKHGLDFAEAYFVFEDSGCVKYPENKRDYGETREAIIGSLNGEFICYVCYAKRSDKIRIISFRRASRKERSIYNGNSPIHN
jgi:uncharacterized DUF497 family protein